MPLLGCRLQGDLPWVKRLAWASWRGASVLSVMAVQTMPASVVGAMLLMTLACSLYLIAMVLVRVDGVQR